MVSITKRKVYEIGGKQYKSPVITLPRDWVNFNKPDEVEVIYDSVILIIPPNINESKRKTVIEAMK